MGIIEELQSKVAELTAEVAALKQQFAPVPSLSATYGQPVPQQQQYAQPVPQQHYGQPAPPQQYLNPNSFAPPQQQFIPAQPAPQQQFQQYGQQPVPQQQSSEPVTEAKISELIAPYLESEAMKEAFKAQLAQMGVSGMPSLQPHQYAEAYHRFASVIQQMQTVGAMQQQTQQPVSII